MKRYSPVQIIPAVGWTAVFIIEKEIIEEPLVGFAITEDQTKKELEYQGLIVDGKGKIGPIGNQKEFIGFIDPKRIKENEVFLQATEIINSLEK